MSLNSSPFLHWALGIALTLRGVPAFAEPVKCPSTIDSHRLHRVEIFDGHPSEQASLVPDESTGNGSARAVWKFEPFSGRRIWVVCAYRGTSKTVLLEMPASTRRCEVRFRRHRPQSIDCE
ncbi:STY0301 family protein [Pseudoduganella sp. OTU4001]|uniref:STY0301 family protein n=1 Tax=Pseudoduganella sp. OTU4001 TaxID=3043854 RepID=UPI00406D28C4